MSLEASSDRSRVLQGFGSLRIRQNLDEHDGGDEEELEGDCRGRCLSQSVFGQCIAHGCW